MCCRAEEGSAAVAPAAFDQELPLCSRTVRQMWMRSAASHLWLADGVGSPTVAQTQARQEARRTHALLATVSSDCWAHNVAQPPLASIAGRSIWLGLQAPFGPSRNGSCLTYMCVSASLSGHGEVPDCARFLSRLQAHGASKAAEMRLMQYGAGRGVGAGLRAVAHHRADLQRCCVFAAAPLVACCMLVGKFVAKRASMHQLRIHPEPPWLKASALQAPDDVAPRLQIQRTAHCDKVQDFVARCSCVRLLSKGRS